MIRLVERVSYVLSQPDFRTDTLRALARRLLWRLHWAIRPNEPLILLGWSKGMKIALPRSGSAAQVFYRGYSNREIVGVMDETLRPGDVVLDIGAHIGEYALIASRLVGPQGWVHAIEPQPQAVEIMALNARLNSLENIKIHQFALADREGTVPFKWDRHSWGGFLVAGRGVGNLTVQCTTLDEFLRHEQISRVRLVKIDAAGNERAVLEGGASLFCSPQPPVLLCKLYNPRVVRERFGYEAREIVELLHSWGYRMRALTERGKLLITRDSCYQLFSGRTYGFPILAWREV